MATDALQSREQILDELRRILVDLFELDADDITPQAKLYEDLDIDSIDAVDLVVELKRVTGKRVNPENFKAVRTVDDVIDAVAGLMAN
ncbi:acyl carrier protein [Halopseudomonas salegens]|uniref:Acyl carrier protein n=1 Tax=Halopseudomonas salegens TaxID=1434072 RepID=A0A1H2GVY6_9GAMM|nr:acyl carrier protein [Halopseudomonas salegens]